MMQTLFRYMFALLMTVTGSVVCGAALGMLLHFISIEYLNVVRNVPYEELFSGPAGAVRYGIWNGFRSGLFPGALLGFAAIGGVRRIAAASDILTAAAIIPIATGMAALAGGAGAYAAAKLIGPSSLLPEQIALQVGGPYRVVCGYGLAYGASAGAIVSAFAMSVWLWRRRE